MAGLEIEGVHVRFESVPALSDVNMSVAPGEWLSIIGPNGAGKTTLLRAIAAALPLSAGAVTLEGEDVSGLRSRERARRMAVVPQDQYIPSGWSVEEVVAQGRSAHLGPWKRESEIDRAAIREALQDTDIQGLSSRTVETLSGGERQRVILARALAQTPRLLLLDEPTAHLDLQYQWEMLELVEEARRHRRMTVVAVLHDLNLAAAFSHNLALLRGGRVLAMGTPEEVLVEETIQKGYGRRVSVGRHPATGRPTVVSWPTRNRQTHPCRVHVICGGGTGAAVLRRLVADGHGVTAGVLNVGDTDWETGRVLGISMAEETPFAPISPEALARADALAREAEAVLVTPVPIGPGNAINLRLAAEASERGQKVILVGELNEERDFSQGLAKPLWEHAIQSGAVFVPDIVEALRHLPDA